MSEKDQQARADFGVAFWLELEDAKLRWPNWLKEIRSSGDFRRALMEAGLPVALERECLVLALTLCTMTNRAPPPTNKEVRRQIDRIVKLQQAARLALEPPELPWEFEARLGREINTVVADDGEIECIVYASTIERIRAQHDSLIRLFDELELPAKVERGPKISNVTIAVSYLANVGLEYRPHISSSVVAHLARKVLEPAVNNAGGTHGARVDWYDQAARAMRHAQGLRNAKAAN